MSNIRHMCSCKVTCSAINDREHRYHNAERGATWVNVGRTRQPAQGMLVGFRLQDQLLQHPRWFCFPLWREMQTILRSFQRPGVAASCRALRCSSTLSPEQIERVLETEAKFPLWQYLQELRKEMQGEISSLKTDLHKDIDGLKTDLARQPYKLFGAVVAACGAVAAAGRAIEALGYQVRITPKD